MNKLLGKTIMVQGTSSHAGKSTLVTALCRIFSDMGYKVSPFKSQNMSLNSFVTEDGAEIARSQVVQAMAARTKPIAEMNPILLKPKGDTSSQIILMGKPFADCNAQNYYSDYIPKLMHYAKKTLVSLQKENDIVVIEGAGSPAEINLTDNEIANMFIAKLTNSPVILVADIDRGGVFASLYGTVKLLKPEDQKLIKMFIINKFRGNVEILKSGILKIEELIGIKCNGILPCILDLKLPAEDSVSLEDFEPRNIIEVKVIRLPRISNFTDFEPLSWEPEIRLMYVDNPDQLDTADLIIIPGTKNTVKDLQWMKEKRFTTKLQELEKLNYLIIGICGGFQILGKNIVDMGFENEKEGVYEALNLLPIQTQFLDYQKVTRQVQAEIIGFPPFNGCIIEGYEIHTGVINYELGVNPLLKITNEPKSEQNSFMGAINDRKTVFGSLIHGFWDNDEFRRIFINYLINRKQTKKKSIFKVVKYKDIIEKNIQILANVVKQNINIENIINILEL